MAIFDFLRTWKEAEKEVKAEEKARKEAVKIKEEKARQREEEVYRALKKIIVFPGNKQEFEEFIGYEVRIIDAGGDNKGLVYFKGDWPFSQYSSALREKLVNQGIVGLINATPISYCRCGDDRADYGLPVTKKEKTK